MKTFKEFLAEGGEYAGKMELIKTPLEEARAYAEKKFKEYGRNLDLEIPNFDKNYVLAQNKAKLGKTLRKDMPVIDKKDVKVLQNRLKKGDIDINKPFSKNTNPKDPFPKGLSGEKAKQWLKDGIKKNDGDSKDDKVNTKISDPKAKELKPIQKQIYFDKSINPAAENGIKSSIEFLKANTLVISADDHIIDGHHRFLSAVLINPNMKIKCLQIDLPIKELLPLTLSYTSAVGNKPNQ